jgi:hypothetical protein
MWRITKNIIDAEELEHLMGTEDQVQAVLPKSSDFVEEEFANQPTMEFRLRDDDEEVYFEGLIWKTDILNSPEDVAFAPLDHLGYGYGCTDLQYRDKHGKWVTL